MFSLKYLALLDEVPLQQIVQDGVQLLPHVSNEERPAQGERVLQVCPGVGVEQLQVTDCLIQMSCGARLCHEDRASDK